MSFSKRIESYSIYFGAPNVAATEESRPFQTNDEARRARDLAYRALKKQGRDVYRGVSKNQLRPYWSFGVPCGGYCDVYEIYEVRA